MMHFVMPVPLWEEGGRCQGEKEHTLPPQDTAAQTKMCAKVTPGPVGITLSDGQLVSSGTQSQGR